MASVRQIRTRIKSVRNIRQITRAMKMVASSRVRKAQGQLLEARPYARKMREMIADIAGHCHVQAHPLLRPPRAGRTALLVLTSDKGLCAGFNAQPLQRAARVFEGAGDRTDVLCAGRKGVFFFRRVGITPHREWAGFWQELNYLHADTIGQEIMDGFIAGRWTQVQVIYNRFKSLLVQEPVSEILLPFALCQEPETGRPDFGEHDYEPDLHEVLDQLLPRYLKNAVWHALLESKAAEMAARMQAMEAASQSAAEMIEELTLVMNRARQAVITREISELVGGAEVING